MADAAQQSQDPPTPDEGPIERDASAPAQQTDGGEGQTVDTVGLITDEFGISRSQARMEIATGEMTLDDEPYTPGDKFFLPRDEVVGKTLEVKGGQSRAFRVQIQA
jgi:hypothetical protein